MALIQHKQVEILSLNNLMKIIPPSHKQLMLSDAKFGLQQKDTVIIGKLIDVIERTKSRAVVNSPLMKLKLKEIEENCEGEGFEVFIFGDSVDLVKEIFKSKGKSDVWAAFSNLSIEYYNGTAKPWSLYSLKLRENVDQSQKQEVTLFYQPKKLEYSTLNDVTSGNRFNVFVVIKEVVKHTVVLGNKNKHTILMLMDPSCVKMDRKKLLLHIFFNDPNDHIPEPFQDGDILRLRDMLGDLFHKENKMHGKIFSSNSIVKFRLAEDDDNVTPISSYSAYKLTEQDKKIVRELRQWWVEMEEEVVSSNSVTDSELQETRIKDIVKPSTITFSCMVQEIRVVEHLNVVVLRVTDGTVSKIFSTSVSLNDATQDFVSSTDKAVVNTTEIDVTVFDHLVITAAELRVGDYVQLVNVTCFDILEGTEGNLDSPILDFCMKGKECRINKLYAQSWKARSIERVINGKESSEKSSSDVSLSESNSLNKSSVIKKTSMLSNEKEETEDCVALNHVKRSLHEAFNKDLPSTSGTDITTTPNKSKEKNSRANGYGRLPKRPLYSATTEILDLTDSPEIEMEVSVSEDHIVENHIVKNHSVENHGVENHIADNSSVENHIVNEHAASTQKSSAVKRKYVDSDSSPPKRRKLSTFAWKLQDVYTECSPYPKSSLTEFFERSSNGDKCRVWATLQHIHFTSNNPCQDCKHLLCCHDWIWGLCNSCGSTFSSSDLKEYYSTDTLDSSQTLPCKFCVSSTASSDEQSTVLPFIKLELCLTDIINDNSFAVDLNGDAAEVFFGVKPSFSWTFETSSELYEKALVYNAYNQLRPFQFSLTNISKPDGTSTIQILDTKIKFTKSLNE